MKKFILFVCLSVLFTLISSAGNAARWTGFEDDENENEMFKGPMLDALMSGRVEVELILPEGGDYAADRQWYLRQIATSIRNWPKAVVREIRQTGRTKEFADIERRFSKGVEVVFTKGAPVKVEVLPTRKEIHESCGWQEAAACADRYENKIWMPSKKVLLEDYVESDSSLLTHEFGHLLGLGDQYDEVLREDEAGSFDISWQHSTADTNDGSIMKDATRVGCDDVDGLLYEIDQKYDSPERAKRKSWVSFCGEYVYSPRNPNRPRVKWEDKFFIQQVTDAENIPVSPFRWKICTGDKEECEEVSLDSASTFTGWRNVISKPITLPKPLEKRNYHFQAVGPNQERVEVYNYFERTWCFAYLKEKLVWVQLFERAPKKGKKKGGKVIRQDFYFGGRGREAWFTWSDVEISHAEFSPVTESDEDFLAVCDKDKTSQKCLQWEIEGSSVWLRNFQDSNKGTATRSRGAHNRPVAASRKKTAHLNQKMSQQTRIANLKTSLKSLADKYRQTGAPFEFRN